MKTKSKIKPLKKKEKDKTKDFKTLEDLFKDYKGDYKIEMVFKEDKGKEKF